MSKYHIYFNKHFKTVDGRKHCHHGCHAEIAGNSAQEVADRYRKHGRERGSKIEIVRITEEKEIVVNDWN